MNAVHQILMARELARPDERPLYAYKVTDDEFLALERELTSGFADRRLSLSSREVAASFCLFGAEHYSRGDGSDWWSWDSLKHKLRFEVPDGDIRDAVWSGLQFWRRDVLRGGRFEYLATLVSEGGLPLALLQEEGGRLRRYFHDLLRSHETYPTVEILQLAHNFRAPLPVRMQNFIVYDLAAKLICAVAKMRRRGLPARDFEQSELPLRLDHVAARELIEGLQTAPSATSTAERGILVRTVLQWSDDLLLRRELVLPPRLSRAWLAEALSCANVPARLYLSLQNAEGGRQTVGIANMQVDRYLVDALPARDIVRPSVATEQLRCVVSSSGVDLGSFVPQGGEALSDTPWIFDDDVPDGRLRSTGACRLRATSLLVALPAQGTVDVDGDIAEVGALRGHNRRVVRLRGTLRWRDGHDDITIVTGADDSQEMTFELHGRHPSALVRETDVWLGRPDIFEIMGDGVRRAVAPGNLVWRAHGAPWSGDLRGAVGTGEIGVRRENEVQFHARVHILPEDFTVALCCGVGTRGIIKVRSARITAAGVTPGLGLKAAVTRTTSGFDIEVTADDDAAARAAVCVSIRTNAGTELSINVPFPAEHAAFIDRDGRPLTHDAVISIDELAHVRAVVVSPHVGTWAVDVLDQRGSARIGVLRDVCGGMHTMSLELLRRDLSTILAGHSRPDYQSTLQLVQEGGVIVGGSAPRCQVRRYDAELVPLTELDQHDVVLEPQARARFGDEVVAALRAEAVPLRRPDRTPVTLQRKEPGKWSIDDPRLEPGPWLVLAYQNAYLRTRPLRITMPGDHSVPDNNLEQAMAEPERDLRWTKLSAAVEHLGDDTTGEEWETLRAQLSTLGRYPATTFDTVRAMAHHPRIAVLSLLDAGQRQTLVWNGFEELPFLWEATPIEAWLEAVRGWLQALRARLPESIPIAGILTDAAPGIFGKNKLAPFLECIHDAAYLRDPDVPEPTERWVFPMRDAKMRQQRSGLLSLYRSELAARHPEGWWPAASPFEITRVSEVLSPLTQSFSAQPGFQRVVLETPLVLAEEAVSGAISCDLQQLRRIREFDPEWFDFAYAMGLSFLLGRLYERKEFPFND